MIFEVLRRTLAQHCQQCNCKSRTAPSTAITAGRPAGTRAQEGLPERDRSASVAAMTWFDDPNSSTPFITRRSIGLTVHLHHSRLIAAQHLRFGIPDPRDEKLPYDGQHDRPKKKSCNPVGERTADHADQDDEHGGFQAPPHDDRSQ